MARRLSANCLRRPISTHLNLEQFERRDVPTIYFVHTAMDNGLNMTPTPGSFREAINFINGGLHDEIQFDFIFDGGVGSKISPPTPLPGFGKPVTIGGGGFKVEINGSATSGGPGLVFTAGGTLRAMAVTGFTGAGVMVTGGAVTIDSCFIGTNLAGTTPIANKGGGIVISTAGNVIKDSVISGNGKDGINLTGPAAGANTIIGNKIGVAANGTSPMSNAVAGIRIDMGPGNTVGGATAGNIIAGNGSHGIHVVGAKASSNFIYGNKIGIASAPNGGDGIQILDAPATKIGDVGKGNSIANNKGSGIALVAAGGLAGTAPGTIILANRIGTNETGTADLGNLGLGVSIKGLANNTIGDALTGAGNLISGNDGGGISIMKGDKNTIAGNFIGTNAGGDASIPNALAGVHIASAENNLGGITPDHRNVISGNAGLGVILVGADAKFNNIRGNSIGVNAAGSAALANSAVGVTIVAGASFNRIGGGDLDDGTDDDVVNVRNTISGNGKSGVIVADATSIGNTVRGNFIGLLPSGLGTAPNLEDGVRLENSVAGEIGGIGDLEGNTISRNTLTGITITGATAKSNFVRGNKIGTGPDGTTDRGNKSYGILITGTAAENVIGGDDDDDGLMDTIVKSANTIAFNGETHTHKGHGILIVDGTGNRIRGNSSFKNYGRGIDLNDDAPTLNEPGDVATGANESQDYPVAVYRSAAGVLTWQVEGGAAGSMIAVDFFSNDELDPSGFGEGKILLGSQTIAFNADGIAMCTSNYPAAMLVSATATDAAGNTSEFSTVDTDADALADAWETEIMGEFRGLDINEDGVTELNLFALGARPLRKDLFVEVDAMVSRVPEAAIFDMATEAKNGGVINAFSKAPNANNPNGSVGIALHAFLDDVDIPLSAFPNTWVEFDAVKNTTVLNGGKAGAFGSKAQRMDGNWVNIRAAMKLTHRYCIFADSYGAGGSSGLAEGTKLAASVNDFMVTIRPNFWVAAGHAAPDAKDRAGTFMHELGHTIGLDHGGGDFDNYKPNYHSVMNYTWQVPNGLRRGKLPGVADYKTSWVLDYSHVALAELNENMLSEAAPGIGGNVDYKVPYGGKLVDGGAFVGKLGAENGAIDWNRNKAIDAGTVLKDTNFDGVISSSLKGHDDWSMIKFYFAESPEFADGNHGVGHANELATSPTPPRVETITIGDGTAQRSRVTSVTIDFDQVVGLPTNPADAFSLVRQSDNMAVTLLAAIVDDDQTHVTLTFTAGAVQGGSLADGRYTLTILAGQVSGFGGSLDGNGDGTAGDNYILASAAAPNAPTNIFRLFGDANGDGDADIADFAAFRAAFGTGPSIFDSDGDGDTDIGDFVAFRARFGVMLP